LDHQIYLRSTGFFARRVFVIAPVTLVLDFGVLPSRELLQRGGPVQPVFFLTAFEVFSGSRGEPSMIRFEAVSNPTEEAASRKLNKRESVLPVLNGGIRVGDDSGRDQNAAAGRETDDEVVIPADEVPALVGVELPQSTNEAHTVCLVGMVDMGRRYREGAKVGGESGERAARPHTIEGGVLLQQDLLHLMVAFVDGIAEGLKHSWRGVLSRILSAK
jgi:hypothetical protein